MNLKNIFLLTVTFFSLSSANAMFDVALGDNCAITPYQKSDGSVEIGQTNIPIGLMISAKEMMEIRTLINSGDLSTERGGRVLAPGLLLLRNDDNYKLIKKAQVNDATLYHRIRFVKDSLGRYSIKFMTSSIGSQEATCIAR